MGRVGLRLCGAALLAGAILSLFAPLTPSGHWLVGLFLLVYALAVLGRAWTFTPDGRLDYRAALSLRLLSFNAPYRPDKDSDFRMKIPVNLIFTLDSLLPRVRMHAVEDIVIRDGGHDLPARIYWPRPSGQSPQPLIVYFHGGGFVLGSVAIFDPLVRVLARATSAIVVSIDYRLAPRHPFPAAVDDALAGLNWAAAKAERLGACPDRIFVAGDSAGGNLAAVSCLRARESGGPAIAGQILYYPAIDLRPPDGRAGRLLSPDDYGLPAAAIDAFISAYRGRSGDLSHPSMSPITAADLSGLPPALVVTAGFDPLADDALVYAARLRQAGVLVDAAHFPDMIHGFAGSGIFPQRREVMRRTGAFVEDVSSVIGRPKSERSTPVQSSTATSG